MIDLGRIATAPNTVGYYLLILCVAAGLGAALGVIRPVRREIVPRSSHVIQAQILLSIVGAVIIVVVAESLARAFAIVGAAGLVRYRARIDDPKDAGVMLVALALGLITGSGLFGFAALTCAFVIGMLWLLESLEPPARSRMQLVIGTRDAAKLQAEVEHALQHKGVAYELVDASSNELRYEVTVPFQAKIDKLTKMIKRLNGADDTVVDWDTKRPKTIESRGSAGASGSPARRGG